MHAYHYIDGHEQYMHRQPGEAWTVTCTCPGFARRTSYKRDLCVHVGQAIRQQRLDDTEAYRRRISEEAPKKKRRRLDLSQFAFIPSTKLLNPDSKEA